MIKISVKSDVSALARKLDAFATTQLRFATSQALNRTGMLAIQAERKTMQGSLDRPKPFTVNHGLRLNRARKQSPEATVYIPPIQSRYLAPEIEGGSQLLSAGSQAILRPVDQATDQYGNLPRGLLARLRGRPDIFIGPIAFPSGTISGVWQRRKAPRRAKRNPNPGRGGLKLLVRFADPSTVKTRYRFGEATTATAKTQFAPILREELVEAMRTAR